MAQLADLLEAQIDALLKQWIAGVELSLAPGPRTTPEILDHLPDFLRQVIAALREPTPRAAVPPVDGQPVGRKHGAQRFRLGFEIEAVVREYGLLLHLLLDLVEQAGVSVSIRELRRLNDLVTDAVAEATAEYARRLAETAQTALARENERLSQLFDQAPLSIGHVTGPDHVFAFANRGLIQLLGGRKLAGLPLAQAIPELQSQSIMGLLDGVYATGETFTAREIRAFIDRTGQGVMSEAIFDLVYQATRDVTGKIDGVFMIAVEVTEAARARREGERLKVQLETTLLSMGDGVLVTNAGGQITLLNPAAEKLTGWSAGEALGESVTTVLTLVDAVSKAPIPSPFAAVLCGEAPRHLGDQILLVRRDGTRFAFADSLAPMRDAAGVIVGAVLVFRDETEARRKDAELRTFRAVVEASTDFISFGRPGGRPDFVNAAGLRMVGLDSLEAARALEVGDYYTPETRLATIAALLPEVRAGRAFHGETMLRHFKTGEAIPVSQSAFAVNDESGRPLVLAAVIRDRREQQRAEAERDRLLADAVAARREADLQREHLTAAFTQAPVAVGILRGADEVVILANEAICRIWGVTQAEVLNRPIFDLLLDAKEQGFPALLAQVRSTGVPFVGREATVTLPRLGGGTEDLFINFVYQPLRAADGSVLDILVVATDVTVEVTARRTAEAVSAEFEAMFNSLPDGAFLAGPTGMRRANEAGLRVLGVEKIEDLQRPIDELAVLLRNRDGTTGEDVGPGRSPTARALAGEVVREEYFLFNARLGRDIRLRSVASPIRVGGVITGAVVLHADITDQHRAIEALQQREESFRTLAEAIPQQVWTSRADGSLDFVNERVLAYFASTEEEVLGAGWLGVLHPDDIDRTVARWSRSLTTGEEYEVEFRLRRADGTYRWHLGRARASRDSRGQITKWFGTNTDIDEAKRFREELETRTEFEQHLLGIVSHDLRNPLAAIVLSATSLLQMKDQSERVTKLARRIHGSAERSARMISDLLDFTQARLGGGIRLERRPCDLYTLTSSTLDEVEAAHPDRDIELTRSGEAQGTFDGDRIVQVITNLVTNALKYSPPDTPVAVRVTGRDAQVELTVHNECPPIPPEQLGRIFLPLQRASDQIDRKTRSVGLGLYIVAAIVRAHGGTVRVVSTAEAGTTFTVLLPREPGAKG